MTQATILAANTTAATSTDIAVAAGAVVTVGIFSASEAQLPMGVNFTVMVDTPGADSVEAVLDNQRRTVQVNGPATYRVKRPAYTGTAFGVYSET